MKPLRMTLALAAFALATAAFAVKPGEIAPDFHGTDSNGKAQTLSQYRGKYVVLEWANQGCPPTSRSTTRAATWRRCKNNGPPRAWCGSRSSRPHPASRAT